MKTLILDNYDSFTYNLYQYVAELGGGPAVYRNDAVSIEEVATLGISHIILSPGPGNPDTDRDIGISRQLIDFAVESNIPLLGVCLGHQTIVHHFGGVVDKAPEIFHGRSSEVNLLEPRSKIFTDLPSSIEVMRYHSLCANPTSLPTELRVTAETENGIIMAVDHTDHSLYGIQFHPESIGTPEGKRILQNFLAQS